jgi:hypothetical protein
MSQLVRLGAVASVLHSEGLTKEGYVLAFFQIGEASRRNLQSFEMSSVVQNQLSR